MAPRRNALPKQFALEGKYANYFKVGHNALEFLIDFGQSYASDALQESCHTRIVTSPLYAKYFLKTLAQAVEQYEARYGAIETGGE